MPRRDEPQLPGIDTGVKGSRLQQLASEAGLACPKCGKTDYRLEYDRAGKRTGFRICLKDGTRWPVGGPA